MNMTNVNVSELEGAALDWAVAQIDDRDLYDLDWRWVDGEMLGFGTIGSSPEFVCFRIGEPVMFGTTPMYSPSTEWSQGGPLIERHQIELEWIGTDGKAIAWDAYHQDIVQFQCADTPLIAAMRAIVAAKTGETVEVPESLA